MDTQLTVRLPRALADEVDRRAVQSGLKRADIVRAALVAYLQQPRTVDGPRPYDLVSDLIGSDRRADVGDSSTRRRMLDRLRRHATRPA